MVASLSQGPPAMTQCSRKPNPGIWCWFHTPNHSVTASGLQAQRLQDHIWKLLVSLEVEGR